jgi:hypothetical protein
VNLVSIDLVLDYDQADVVGDVSSRRTTMELTTLEISQP